MEEARVSIGFHSPFEGFERIGREELVMDSAGVLDGPDGDRIAENQVGTLQDFQAFKRQRE